MPSFTRTSLLIFVCLLSAAGLRAQEGLNYWGFRNAIPSQKFQPANLAFREDEKFGIAFDASAYGSNSGFTFQGIQQKGGYIPLSVRERMVDQCSNGFQLSAGYRLGYLNVNYKAGELPLSFFVEDRTGIAASFSNGNTLGLILLGNRPYAGQTVSDDKMKFAFASWRSWGLGLGLGKGNIRFGARVKFLQGLSYAGLQTSRLSLTTATDGTSLDILANYNLSIANQGKAGLLGNRGFGAGVDAGVTMQLSDKLQLDAAVLDAGFISWRNLDRMQSDVNVHFEGINVASLFADNVDSSIQHSVDSLKGLLLPDTVNAKLMTLPGMQIRLGAKFQLSENDCILPLIIYQPFGIGGFTRMPMLNISYQRKLGEQFTLGANVYGGGNDLYGFGLMGAANFEINGAYRLHVQLMTDNMLGWAIKPIGKGFGVQAGLGFDILGQ